MCQYASTPITNDFSDKVVHSKVNKSAVIITIISSKLHLDKTHKNGCASLRTIPGQIVCQIKEFENSKCEFLKRFWLMTYVWLRKTVSCFVITKHLPKHSTVGSPYCRDSHWSHFLPPRPSTQGHWPSNSLHWGLRLPSSSQSQASQPTPLASFQWSGAHWPQSSPITLGRHGHCPVVRLQISSASLSDPSGLQLHSAQKSHA